MTPQNAKTIDDICEMPRDNMDYKDWWILVTEDEVSIVKQKMGCLSVASINIPKDILDKFIDWYETGTPPDKE